jgi:hypothetical protein
MSSIIYYSNFCNHSKKLLQSLSKTTVNKDTHFICIDKRVKDEKGKVYIVLENGQKIIMPENVSKVPALLLLNKNYQVIYGDSIIDYFKPKEEIVTKAATNNNMEPMAYSFGGGGNYGIMSDNYSFLDMNPDDLNTKGNGGTRQMHNYVNLNYTDSVNINTPNDDFDYKNEKIPESLTIEKLQQQRDQELNNLGMKR